MAKLVPGQNDLKSVNPALALEWHPTKNLPNTSESVLGGGTTPYWWQCALGHEWEANVGNRLRGRGCPYCGNRAVLPGFNDLATLAPGKLAEWHPSKNLPITPDSISPNTTKILWWQCSKGHEWQSKADTKKGCPFCANWKINPGENDLNTLYPELCLEWDQEKNFPLRSTHVGPGTPNKAWWICPKGHSYQASINARAIRRTGCPYCSHKSLLTGFNDLETLHPQLAAEWHPIKNGNLQAREVINGSGAKFWWLCSQGHSFQATANKRVSQGSGCGFCANHAALVGFNDLQTKFPELLTEWDFEKNIIQPFEVTAGTNTKVWWKCSLGHSWFTQISSRSRLGGGCPYCAGVRTLPGFNDLETKRPDLAKQWHPTKNNKKPGEVGFGSTKFWWVCPEGHDYFASVANRASGMGCSRCAKYGFDTTQSAKLYFILNDDLKARKMGIANLTSKRLDNFQERGWRTLHKVESSSGLAILELETRMFRWLRKEVGLTVYLEKQDMQRMAGFTETFSLEAVTNTEIIRKIESEWSLISSKEKFAVEGAP